MLARFSSKFLCAGVVGAPMVVLQTVAWLSSWLLRSFESKSISSVLVGSSNRCWWCFRGCRCCGRTVSYLLSLPPVVIGCIYFCYLSRAFVICLLSSGIAQISAGIGAAASCDLILAENSGSNLETRPSQHPHLEQIISRWYCPRQIRYQQFKPRPIHQWVTDPLPKGVLMKFGASEVHLVHSDKTTCWSQ